MMTSLRGINDLARHNGPLSAEIRAALDRVLDSGWYVLGTEVTAFEQAFADYCGVAHAVGVANGTDALELALAAVGVGRGDAVALAANAGGYGTTAVNALGAEPIYVDVDPLRAGLDPKGLDRACRSRDIRAVIITHLYGTLASVEETVRVAATHGVKVIEDCAQAHGATRAGRRAGSWGDAATFSFYPTKNLGALGDGGMVVTNDPDVARLVARTRQYGWEGKYRQVALPARNSRLDELQAAVLLAKLPHLDGWNARRRVVAGRYAAQLTHPKVTLAVPAGPDCESTPPAVAEDYVAHLFVIRTAERGALADHLRRHGVPYDIHYPIPDYRAPVFGDRFAEVCLPVTESLCDEVLTLPCFPEMTDDQVDLIADVVNRWDR
jgi:dTDP-4-amino-4,6-dideoxygalactose transaminase